MSIDCGKFSLSAVAFERDCYDFCPNIDAEKDYYQEIYWPVRRWEVRMPSFEKDELNAFERLFLELAETKEGLTMAFLLQLGIPKDMFKNICGQLQARQFLNNELKLTQKGQKAVAGKDYFQEELILARAERRFLFQDVFSGRLLPYCGTDEDYRYIRGLNNNRKAEISKKNVLVLWPNKQTATLPTGAKVIRAMRQYFAIERHLTSDVPEREPEDASVEGEARIRICDSPNEINYCYIRCIMSIDPLRVTNNEVDDIWKVQTPFGQESNILLEQSMREASQEDTAFKEKIEEIATALRENLKGKVPFANIYNVEIIEKYPEIELNPPLKQCIEKLALLQKHLEEGEPLTAYRVEIANAIDYMIRIYRDGISAGKRETIKQQLESLSKGYQGEIQLKAIIKELAGKYSQFYDRFEGSYSTDNPNVNRSRLMDMVDDEISKKYYKKERAVYLLLATEFTNYAPWKRAMADYAQGAHRNTLYQDIAKIEEKRSKESAHGGVNTISDITLEEVKLGKRVLDTLIRAYYGKEIENE